MPPVGILAALNSDAQDKAAYSGERRNEVQNGAGTSEVDEMQPPPAKLAGGVASLRRAPVELNQRS